MKLGKNIKVFFFLIAVAPTRIQFKRLHSNFVTEKTYNISCTTYGSNPQAYTRIWHENQELEILESKAISSLESVITAKFQPLAEDHGSFLICKAENPLIANSAVEDHWKIDVKCKFYYFNIVLDQKCSLIGDFLKL